MSRGGWCVVGFTDKEAVKQETTAQDWVSTLVSVKLLDFFNETSGQNWLFLKQNKVTF